MTNLEAKILKLVNEEKSFSIDYTDEDFPIIVGNVESWLNFSSKPVTLKQAVKNTLDNKDPWYD